MSMGANLLRFPNQGTEAPKREPQTLRPALVLQAFDPSQTAELHAAALRTSAYARALVEFVRKDRDLARRAGVETIAIEIVAITAGEKFVRVRDALDEAALSGKPIHLTTEGLAILRAVETLVAEAYPNMRKLGIYEAQAPAPAAASEPQVPAAPAALAQVTSPSTEQPPKSSDRYLIVPLVILGVLALAGIVVMAMQGPSRPPRAAPSEEGS